jgi:hypothetical protein
MIGAATIMNTANAVGIFQAKLGIFIRFPPPLSELPQLARTSLAGLYFGTALPRLDHEAPVFIELQAVSSLWTPPDHEQAGKKRASKIFSGCSRCVQFGAKDQLF